MNHYLYISVQVKMQWKCSISRFICQLITTEFYIPEMRYSSLELNFHSYNIQRLLIDLPICKYN